METRFIFVFLTDWHYEQLVRVNDFCRDLCEEYRANPYDVHR